MVITRKRKIMFLLMVAILIACLSFITFLRDLYACPGVVAPVVEEPPEPRVYEKSGSGFTVLMYNKLLGREPEDSGLELWRELLETRTITAAEMVKRIILGEEAQNRISGYSEFLTFLYDKILNREPDTDGYNSWLDIINAGMTKEAVVESFANSQEFADLYSQFGVIP